MKNKNVYLIFLLFGADAIFTLIASLLLMKWGQIVGITAFFALLFLIMIYLLQGMIKQLYDLLLDPPMPGKTINPFQIIAFGKVLWQYPKGGSFVFVVQKEGVDGELKNGIDTPIDIPIFRKTKVGPKSFYTEEEYFRLVEEYFDAEKHGVKQEEFCRAHHIGSTRNLRKYIDLYKKKKQMIPN